MILWVLTCVHFCLLSLGWIKTPRAAFPLCAAAPLCPPVQRSWQILTSSEVWLRSGGKLEALSMKEKHPSELNLSKMYTKTSESMWENMLWSDETKVQLSWLQFKTNHPENTTQSEARRRQRQALGLLFFSWNEFFSLFHSRCHAADCLAPNLQDSNEKCHILARTHRMQPNATKRGFTRRSLGKAPTGIWQNIWGSLTPPQCSDVHRRSPHSLTDLEHFCREEWADTIKSRCAVLIDSYLIRLRPGMGCIYYLKFQLVFRWNILVPDQIKGEMLHRRLLFYVFKDLDTFHVS